MDEVVNMIAEYWLYWGIPLVFLAVVAWVYRPSAKKRYKADGDIPFEKDVDETRAQRRAHYPP